MSDTTQLTPTVYESVTEALRDGGIGLFMHIDNMQAFVVGDSFASKPLFPGETPDYGKLTKRSKFRRDLQLNVDQDECYHIFYLNGTPIGFVALDVSDRWCIVYRANQGEASYLLEHVAQAGAAISDTSTWVYPR